MLVETNCLWLAPQGSEASGTNQPSQYIELKSWHKQTRFGEDTEDFQRRLKEIIEQEWISIADAPKSIKQKYLDTLDSREVGGTAPVFLEKLSEFKDHVDIMNICLPFVGNLRKNVLDTIRILKEGVLGAL